MAERAMDRVIRLAEAQPGLTVAQLAALAGCSEGMVCKSLHLYERAQAGREVARRMAEVLARVEELEARVARLEGMGERADGASRVWLRGRERRPARDSA